MFHPECAWLAPPLATGQCLPSRGARAQTPRGWYAAARDANLALALLTNFILRLAGAEKTLLRDPAGRSGGGGRDTQGSRG